MGQSLSQIYIHLIFGTKGRYPFIKGEVEASLYSFLSGIFKNMDSPAIKINGVPDHVHILFHFSKNHALAKVVEEVKKSSSKWMKEKGVKEFSWQIGYAAFSVSSSKVEVVSNYIINQQAHHRKKSFQEEIEEFSKEYRIIEYDPKYFWE